MKAASAFVKTDTITTPTYVHRYDHAFEAINLLVAITTKTDYAPPDI